MSAAENKAVFLSYASQDAEAAQRIAEALRGAGLEVWFDKNELAGGDAWDGKIRKQIKECALFVPVISAVTQARLEGYFRLEWKLAAQRTHTMADAKPFLLPVVIDATGDAEAHVPEEFRAVQWTRLPGGNTPEKFCERVKKLLGGENVAQGSSLPAVGASLDDARGRGRAAPLQKPSRPWLVPAILGAAAIAAVALWRPWKNSAPAPAVTVAAKSAAVTSPLTEAQKLVVKARQILDDGDELNREIFFLAEDLVKRAIDLDPAEPSARAFYAELSYWMTWNGFDSSETRRDLMGRQAERARSLAPDSTEVQIAVANVRIRLRQDLPGLEHDLLVLAAREPKNWRVQRALGMTYRFLNRPDDAIASLRRARDLSNELPLASADLANVLLRRGRFAEAETIVAQALAKGSSGRLLTFDVMIKTIWRGDRAGAAAAIAAWPDWLRLEDRGASQAWRAWLWSDRPEKALAAAQRLPRDYLNDTFFTGPRAALTARAHERAGHADAARSDWRTVVQLCDRELTSGPENFGAQYWKAWALARLGDTAAAQALCTQMEQRNLLATNSLISGSNDVPALWATVGRSDLAIAELLVRRLDDDRIAVTRTQLELDPAFESLRADPRYKDVWAVAPTPEKTPTALTTSTLDAKSVAVLAFANLSDDKANEYFSDGISEELLNVLAKVPGLKVTARTSSFHFKGKDSPIPEIAKQLGVAYVVEGSVRKAGDRVRITAQLIKAADGFHVWSDTFTRELKDVFAVQDEIAGLIAQNLQLTLRTKTRARTVNPEAYELLLKGRASFSRGMPAEYPQGIQYLKDSLAIAPDFAAAWGRLAMGYALAFAQNVPGWLAREEIMRLARQAADRAIELDQEQALGHYAQCLISYLGDWDWARADAAMQRVLALTPGDAESLGLAASLELVAGHISRGRDTAQRAVTLDPLNFIPAYQLIKAQWQSGDYVELERESKRMIAIYPGSPYGHTFLSYSLLLRGRADEAAQAAKLVPSDAYRLTSLALAHYAQGKTTEADAELEQLKKQFGKTSAYQIAENYAFRKDLSRAFEWLEAAYRVRDSGLTLITNDPFLANLRGDARWSAFMRKMNLPAGGTK
ncbi:MAG: TIR domain-containing protein [Undibacterium sp.]|nr:TIR domain-containing protein [Opitutaceae bacterium]